MKFFSASTFDQDVEKATDDNNTQEDWSLIIEVCDKITANPRCAKDYLKSVLKRIGHDDPHVAIYALTLLDACVNNCGKNFHLEVASAAFEAEFRKLLSKVDSTVALKMRLKLKQWSEKEFKTDPQLNLIPSLYHKLKQEGHSFTEQSQKSSKSSAINQAALKDPNVVASQQEEDDIAKAIELSLKESAKPSPKKSTTTTSSAYPSLYPSFNSNAASSTPTTSTTATSSQPAEPRKVRALYDFEAAEDNELTFKAGEIICILDDADQNWWKGSNQRGEGLFPANFVTADMGATEKKEDKEQDSAKAKKGGEAAAVEKYIPEINEEKIDKLLNLLHEANPEDASQDPPELTRLEEEVHQMGPLIDAELERVDRKHAQLAMLNSSLVDAINLYHTLMSPYTMNSSGAGGHSFGAPQPQTQGYTNPMYSMGPPPPQMYSPQMQGQFMPQNIPMSFHNGHQQSPQTHQHIYSQLPNSPAVTMSQQHPQQQQHQQQQMPPHQQQQQQQMPPQQIQQIPFSQSMQQHMIPPGIMNQPQTQPQQNGMQHHPQQHLQQQQQQLQQQQQQQPQNGIPQPHQQMLMGGGHRQMPNFQHYPMGQHMVGGGGNPGVVGAAAAAALGINSINQPVTQTFLGQNEQNSIPIYQQQR